MIWVDGIKQPWEWEAMWQLLGKEAVNDGQSDRCSAVDDESGETWQYMGSSSAGTPSTILHEFRHRCHPKTKRREYRRIQASDGFVLLFKRGLLK